MSKTNGASRAGLYLSIGSSILLMLGAIGSVFYIGFKVQATSDALELMGRRVSIVETGVTVSQDRLTKIEVSQNEIETQFCAQDIVRNLMHANDMRQMAQLWEKQFGTRLPTDNAYYPTICNRRVKP